MLIVALSPNSKFGEEQSLGLLSIPRILKGNHLGVMQCAKQRRASVAAAPCSCSFSTVDSLGNAMELVI